MSISTNLDRPLDIATAFQDLWKTIRKMPRIGVAVVDLNGQFQFANTAFREIFYESAAFELVGRTIEELEGEAVSGERLAVFRTVCETGEPASLRHTRLGQRLESYIAPWRFESDSGPPENVIIISRFVDGHVVSSDDPVIESDFNSWGELDVLTSRQLEVLAALRKGFTQKRTAELLGVKPKTVETHRDQLIRRLGARSTLQAIRLADQAGLTLENAKKERHEPRWKQD